MTVAAEVTVPTVWLVLPLAALVFVGWYLLADWLMTRYIDPVVMRWIRDRARRDGLSDEQIDELMEGRQ